MNNTEKVPSTIVNGYKTAAPFPYKYCGYLLSHHSQLQILKTLKKKQSFV
jgi:hypothetical protein